MSQHDFINLGAAGCRWTGGERHGWFCGKLDVKNNICSRYGQLTLHKEKEPIRHELCCKLAGTEAWSSILKARK